MRQRGAHCLLLPPSNVLSTTFTGSPAQPHPRLLPCAPGSPPNSQPTHPAARHCGPNNVHSPPHPLPPQVRKLHPSRCSGHSLGSRPTSSGASPHFPPQGVCVTTCPDFHHDDPRPPTGSHLDHITGLPSAASAPPPYGLHTAAQASTLLCLTQTRASPGPLPSALPPALVLSPRLHSICCPSCSLHLDSSLQVHTAVPSSPSAQPLDATFSVRPSLGI